MKGFSTVRGDNIDFAFWLIFGVADHPDQAIPKHVKLRIWDRCGGRCHITGRKIRVGDKWQFDHIKALRDDGEHREFNIAPALDAPHKEKTAAEAGERSKVDRIRAKHVGLRETSPGFRKHPTLKRSVSGQVVPR